MLGPFNVNLRRGDRGGDKGDTDGGNDAGYHGDKNGAAPSATGGGGGGRNLEKQRDFGQGKGVRVVPIAKSQGREANVLAGKRKERGTSKSKGSGGSIKRSKPSNPNPRSIAEIRNFCCPACNHCQVHFAFFCTSDRSYKNGLLLNSHVNLYQCKTI